MRYCINVQENNVIKVTPKIPESLVSKILAIKGVNYIEELSSSYSNVVIDLDYKKKVQLELKYLLCN